MGGLLVRRYDAGRVLRKPWLHLLPHSPQNKRWVDWWWWTLLGKTKHPHHWNILQEGNSLQRNLYPVGPPPWMGHTGGTGTLVPWLTAFAVAFLHSCVSKKFLSTFLYASPQYSICPLSPFLRAYFMPLNIPTHSPQSFYLFLHAYPILPYLFQLIISPRPLWNSLIFVGVSRAISPSCCAREAIWRPPIISRSGCLWSTTSSPASSVHSTDVKLRSTSK